MTFELHTYSVLWAIDIRARSVAQLNDLIGKMSNRNVGKFRDVYVNAEKQYTANPELFELLIKVENLTEESLFHPDNKFIMAKSVIDKVKCG